MLRASKYKQKQVGKLQWTLDRARELYNAALQERRDAYRMCQVSISYNQQAAQLSEIKAIRPEYHDIYSQVLQDVLQRVKKAYDHFFRRVKAGQTPGYPRFQGYGRYDSFIYPQSGFSVTEDNRVCLSKIGTIKVKFPKGKQANPPGGTMKTCTIKREGTHWFIVFTCEVEQELVYHPSKQAVGIDLGLLHFATLSDGALRGHASEKPPALAVGSRHTTISYCVAFCSLFASNLRSINVPAYVYAERGENLSCPIYILYSRPLEMLYWILWAV